MDELSAEYGRWEVFSLVLIFFWTGALSYAWYRGIFFLVESIGPRPAGEAYLILPDAAFWVLPAFFLGILSSAIPLDLIYRALLKDRYAEFYAWQHLKHGFDSWRVGKYLAILVILGATVGTALGSDTYVRITESEIIVNPFSTWGKEHRYPYHMVVGVEERSHFRAPNGTLKATRHHAVLFTNGMEWRTLDGLRDPTVSQDREMMRYIAHRAGLEIDEVHIGERDRRRSAETN